MQDKQPRIDECEFCGEYALKTNGRGELICEHRANTGRCKDNKHINQELQLVRQPSRNKPCPCGSGKNYKRCCDIDGPYYRLK